jgi:hypothetical protein
MSVAPESSLRAGANDAVGLPPPPQAAQNIVKLKKHKSLVNAFMMLLKFLRQIADSNSGSIEESAMAALGT